MIRRQFLNVDGSEMLVLSATPEGDGPHPVYIECLHAPGQDSFTEFVLDRMAGNGYASFSHNLFHRQGPGAMGREALPYLIDSEMVADTRELISFIDASKTCEPDRIVIGGHCMGGRVTLLVAASIDRFRGAADFWGGNVMTGKGDNAPKVIDLVKNINCPVIGIFGNEDENPSPEDVDQLDQVLSQHNIPHQFYRYDDAGHAFQNKFNEDKYRDGPAEDAWKKVLEFFNDKVRKD